MVSVSGATRVAAVIGDPISHSRSPAIHNAAFAALGLDWIYVAFPVAEGRVATALDGVRSLGISGLSVTTPHKQAVARAVDEASPAVAALGACNTVVAVDGRLVGHNTDGEGFVAALQAESGMSPAGVRATVLGAGGAAAAIGWALAIEGAEVQIVNRSPEKAAAVAALHDSISVGSPERVASSDLVVNATSVGMAGGPAPGELPVDPDLLSSSMVVADIVYEPMVTPLMEAAAQRDATVLGGLGMLVHQAAAQFTLWTGHPAPIEVMTAAVRAGLAAES